ncbi:uncharacterized protein [Pagrus major]|uniref:uncharacterized protein n=1 Tax=Pagrus major TaxID=143350 RepID=UPI003CC8980F
MSINLRREGLTSEGDGQGESEVLDWLEEVEEGGSDWLNSFFTFLYGLINPLESLEEEEHSASGGVSEAQEEDEDDEDDGRFVLWVTETPPTRDVGLKLQEALKQQLAIIHERVEAKKLAKLALAEVRELLAKEEEEKELELGRKEITARVKERVATRLKEEEEKMEKEEMEKALEKLRKEKTKQLDEKKEEGEDEKEGERKSKKGGEKEEKSEKKVEGEGKKTQEEDKGRGKESAKEKRKKSDRGGRK